MMSDTEIILNACIYAEISLSDLVACWKPHSPEWVQASNLYEAIKKYRHERYGKSVADIFYETATEIPLQELIKKGSKK